MESKKINQWVSAYNPPPAVRGRCSAYVLVSAHGVIDMAYYNHEHKEYFPKDGDGIINGVTHWQHLPDRPPHGG